MVLRFTLPLVLVLYALSNCTPEPKDTASGGETHFLMACDSNASCGTALACMCGICTRACAENAGCQPLSQSATCVSTADRGAGACPDSPATSVCDVACAADDTCRAISSSLHCDHGYCRVGSAAPDGGSPDASTCVRDQLSANEVLFLGDSFFATSHQIPANVEELARQAGSVGADEHYRDVSVLAGNSLALVAPYIADRYAAARAEGAVKVVVMNGGGADVLAGTCDTPPTQSCPVLANAAAATQQLLSQMAADGVQHVVYAFYPNPVDAALQAKMDALRPLVQQACDSSPVPCHWLDLRPTFAGHYGDYVLADGMNPTDAGSAATAAAIWSTMQQNCVAQ